MNESAVRAALADRYELVRRIGEGGAAVVFLARDLRHARDVAVKVLKQDLAITLGHERFLAEIAIAARLQHPHIVPLFDSGDADGHLYYVMPYVAGESLRGLLRRQGALDRAPALAITRQVADALSHAHQQGVLHRDIKPENILLAADGHAFVVDFGIAKAVTAATSDVRTRTGVALGTPGYMSPEQAAGLRELDARTDEYGLACVVYEMLVGEAPGLWVTETAVRLGRFTDAEAGHRVALDRLPGRMEQVLARALALRADDRFPTVAAFVEALLSAAESGPARYTPDDVRDIVGRAAQLELARPTGDGLFTVGGVERIAAEVGIPAEDVRRALEELRPALERAAPLPVPPARRTAPALPVPPGAPAVAIERIVEATVPASHLGTLTDEIQLALGPGTATVWEGALTWRSRPTGGMVPRQLEVYVVPGTRATRIQVTQWGERFAPKVIGVLLGLVTGLPFGAFLGVLLSGIEPGLRYLGAMAGGITGVNVFVRAAIVTHRQQREVELAQVADRLAASITVAAAELPAPQPKLLPAK